jgi:hypothetical protein
MSDWADDTIRKLNQRREEKMEETKRFNHEQLIKRATGIPLWNEVKANLKDRIAELKQKMGTDVVVVQSDQPNEMVLCGVMDRHQILHINFAHETGTVSWECEGKSSGRWELVIADDGKPWFQWGAGISTPTDLMATQMLDALLGI